MTALPIAEALAQLSKLVDDASTTQERIEITKNGRRVAILIGADDYDATRETTAVLSDPALLIAHQEGAPALSDGEALNNDELAEAMKSAARDVDTK